MGQRGAPAAALLGVLALAACFRGPDAVTLARIDSLEATVAEQNRQLADARARPVDTDVALQAELVRGLERKIETLEAQIRVLEAKVLAAGAPPKRRVPDPTAVYAVPVGTSPALGSPKAKVTLVMAFEFACRYCRRAWDTIDDLRKQYGKDLRVVYKQFVVHPTKATHPAQAACAAHKQGRWRPMADLLWTRVFDANQFDAATIDALALEAGLDIARYQSDLAGSCAQEVRDDRALMSKLAVSGTPAFFINGRYMSGARPIGEFTQLIDEELAKATAAIKRGVRADAFYDQEIVGKGLTEVSAP